MENIVEKSKSTKALQHTAGVLLILATLYSLIPFSAFITPFDFNNFEEYGEYLYIISGIPSLTFNFITYIILYTLSSNRPTRIATCILLFACLIEVIFTFFPQFAPPATDIVMLLLGIYAISLILGNNTLDNNTRSWIVLVILMTVYRLILYTMRYYFFWAAESPNDFSTIDFRKVTPIAGYIYSILYFIMYWKLAHCEAFEKRYDHSFMGNYIPNRYFIGAITATIITVGALIGFYCLDITF